MDPSPALEQARFQRRLIHERLIDEDETELAGLLEKCGLPLVLICSSCGHRHPVETKCRQKWCPVCVRAIATKRSLKFALAAAAMKWPLFLTLTVPNVHDDSLPFVRKLRRDFGKLRHRKIWKDNVAGGVASIEITRLRSSDRRRRGLTVTTDQGWHPHLHALIDCEWLAIKTPKPQKGSSRARWKELAKSAHTEFSALWAKVAKEQRAFVWIARAKSHHGLNAGADVAREVLKYSVKGSDLAEAAGRIGPLIHQLRSTRLTTSFGSLFGKNLVRDDANKPPLLCDACGQKPEWIPDYVAEAIIRQK